MKAFKLIVFIAFAIAAFFAINAFISKNKTVANGYVVVELFTSEGCSSCPPADELVATVQKETEGQPVYILAYHVDYWDRLGWKDSFSSAAYSNRQKQYAQWLHSADGIYTPQIVVNGKSQFVGSDGNALHNAVKTNLQQAGAVGISLSDIKVDGDKISLDYQVHSTVANSVLQIALIQKTGQTKVERGENGGHTLNHVQIVRSLQTIPLKHAGGMAGFIAPAGFDTHNAEVIAFVQNTENGAVTGAIKAAL